MSNDKKHILIVEDNLTAVRAAQMLLKLEGCEVDCAKDGNEAVEMATTTIYSGIYMDIGLPIMNGIEACKKIREYEAKNNLEPVPIIAVTANDTKEEAKQYLAAGMQEVLGKPFSKDKTAK